MSRRTTLFSATLASVALLATLSACGDDKAKDASSSPSASGSSSSVTKGTIAGITVTGKVGEQPTVKWADAGVTAADEVQQVLVTGKGDKVASGDKVFIHIWLGDGATKKESYTSFSGKPTVAVASPSQTLAIIAHALQDQTVGSRVLAAASASTAFGDPAGNAQLGLGKDDAAVFVIDIMGKLPSGPDGAEQKPADWAPAVVSSADIPTALDFTGTPAPSGKFQLTTLIKGTGPELTKGQHVYVNYLGQTYVGKEPFDQSYSRGTPFDFDLGGGNVIKGWDQGLVGVPVGSRVILQVPPSWGYGKKGSSGAGISGTDTLYFVVDVLAAV